MKYLKQSIPAMIFYGIFMLTSLVTIAQNDPKIYVYKPDSQELHDKIVKLDSIFFSAYNTCDLDKQASMYADSIEFYHDKGGLTTSKADIMKSIKNNVCGKVTRELIKGSIEVYQIKGFGAIQMGLHRFHNKQEPGALSEPGKFIIIWKQTGEHWQISRVVSLH
jgi:hypothetical protein